MPYMIEAQVMKYHSTPIIVSQLTRHMSSHIVVYFRKILALILAFIYLATATL